MRPWLPGEKCRLCGRASNKLVCRQYASHGFCFNCYKRLWRKGLLPNQQGKEGKEQGK